MDYLINQIMEAFEKGLQNALQINDNDVSINYNKSEINSESDLAQNELIKKNIDLLINADKNNLYTKQNIKAYCNIADAYKKYGLTYTVKNYNELIDIISKIRRLWNYYKFSGGLQDMTLTFDWIDYNGIIDISVIDNAGNRKPISMANENDQFIRIHAGFMDDNDIILNKNTDMSRSLSLMNCYCRNYKASSSFTSMHDAKKDFNGYENTWNMIAEIKRVFPDKKLPTVSPVFAYIKKLPTVKICGHKSIPYLPSAGQMQMIGDLLPVINLALEKMGGNLINNISFDIDRIDDVIVNIDNDANYWTSSEYVYGPLIHTHVWEYKGYLYDQDNTMHENIIVPLYKTV